MYHNPVMLTECIDALDIKPDGIYVDVTFGGGGHSRKIVEKLTTGMLIAFDQDEDAKANTAGFDEKNFILVEANFKYLKRYLRLNGFPKVDGILADLGISSHQIDEGARGFSTRLNGDLDMRMDTSTGITAKELVATYSERDLVHILSLYGEVRNSKTVAKTIVRMRAEQEINTTADLVKILTSVAPRGKEFRFYAQVFQAIRIEVNDELDALREMLEQTKEVLKPNGKLVVMSYHSLEDRLVKNFIRKGKFKGELEKDFYGNPIKPFNAINNRPITASEAELEENNRARSAKLRVAELIEN